MQCHHIFICVAWRGVCVCVYRGNSGSIWSEPERAPNTRGTGSGFICMYVCMYVCGLIISVRRELNFEPAR